MSRLLAIIALCLASGLASAREPCGVPVASNDGWPIETQERSGIDAERLCAMIGRLDELDANIHSVLLVHEGQLVFEHYRSGLDEARGNPPAKVVFGPEVRHDVRSVSKSVVSLLTGIAIDRKLIASIDVPVAGYFPEYEEILTPEKRRILIRHLLTMSSGIAWDESGPYDKGNSEVVMNLMPDPTRYALDQPMASKPGERWNYNGGSVALIGAIIEKASGKDLVDFAQESLLEPLSISDFEWPKLANGKIAVASGLRLRPRDMAKLGQLMLQDGMWNGKQIVSANWLAQSVQPSIATQSMFYGYLWWVGSTRTDAGTVDWFEAYGYGSQRVMVMPSLDLVIVFTAGRYGIPDEWAVSDALIEGYILPAVMRR
jgi:CubicO group peptidase (beta-lactamase class C family)